MQSNCANKRYCKGAETRPPRRTVTGFISGALIFTEAQASVGRRSRPVRTYGQSTMPSQFLSSHDGDDIELDRLEPRFQLNQSLANGENGGLGAVVDLQLVKDITDVVFDGLLT